MTGVIVAQTEKWEERLSWLPCSTRAWGFGISTWAVCTSEGPHVPTPAAFCTSEIWKCPYRLVGCSWTWFCCGPPMGLLGVEAGGGILCERRGSWSVQVLRASLCGHRCATQLASGGSVCMKVFVHACSLQPRFSIGNHSRVALPGFARGWEGISEMNRQKSVNGEGNSLLWGWAARLSVAQPELQWQAPSTAAQLVGKASVHCAGEQAVRKDADRFFVFQPDKVPDASGCGVYPWEDPALALFTWTCWFDEGWKAEGFLCL